MTSPQVADVVWQQRLATVAAELDAAAMEGTSRCPDQALGAVVRALEVASRRFLAVQVTLVAEAVERGLPVAAGCKDGAGWLRALVNLTPAEAARRADVGERLLRPPGGPGPDLDADLLPAREALLAGTVTLEHARTVAEAADRLAPPAVPPGAVRPEVRGEALHLLVEQAERLDARQLRILTRRLTVQLDPGGDARLAKDEALQAEYRGLTVSSTGAGLVQLNGLLTAECAGLLATAIDAGAAPQPAADGTPDPRTAAMRRHDSLHQLLAQVVAADGVLPTTHGAAARLLVVVPHTALRDALGGAPVVARAPATSLDGWPVPSSQVSRQACTAELVPVLVDDVGNPLDVGDTQYLFPPRIRTAVITRDRGCTWPGCAAPPSWCDVHHLRPFSAGGPTSVSNGALLCGRHHRHVHQHRHHGQLRDGTIHWSAGPPHDQPHEAGVTVVQRLINHLVDRTEHRKRDHPPRAG